MAALVPLEVCTPIPFYAHLSIIDQYRVSWESVVGEDIASRLHQLPGLEQQLKDWESTTKATMQALLNEHANKYC
jgi:hypothetical protein